MADLKDIKYYPDRFYIRLNGCDIEHLFEPTDDFTLTLDQSVFIHEYYHYLTNISTFQGVRSFHAAFGDLFRLVTILTHRRGFDAFPVNQNILEDCAYEVGYWNSLNDIFREDNVNQALALETKNSPSGQFRIVNIEKEIGEEFFVKKDGKEYKGRREYVRLDIEDLPQTTQFRLPIGAIDEFLSASIDEFLFEKGLSNYTEIFNDRPFYPYAAYDKIIQYFGLRLGSREKIWVAYYALHACNPAVTLYGILQKVVKDGQDQLENNPCEYLEKNFPVLSQYDCLINELDHFIEEAKQARRQLTAQLLAYFQDRFITANALIKKDPFYFVRPFLVDNLDDIRGRQEFWIDMMRIKTCFPEPLFITGKEFKTTRPYEYGADLTILALAIYEIIESLENNKVAKRLDHYKNKYDFPDGYDCFEDVSTFSVPPLRAYWHKALNEIGLYKFYLDNLKP